MEDQKTWQDLNFQHNIYQRETSSHRDRVALVCANQELSILFYEAKPLLIVPSHRLHNWTLSQTKSNTQTHHRWNQTIQLKTERRSDLSDFINRVWLQLNVCGCFQIQLKQIFNFNETITSHAQSQLCSHVPQDSRPYKIKLKSQHDTSPEFSKSVNV